MPFDAAPGLELSKWVESRINGGMVTSIDPADIPEGSLQLAKNARVRFDKTFRRHGHTRMEPPAQDSFRVLKIATLVDNQGNSYTFRFTPENVRQRNASSWDQLTGSLTGAETDRFKTVVINNQFVFSNNGADPIKLINPGAGTYANLGNAPRYRYITGFYDRVVGAHRVGGGSFNVEVGWSGLGNIAQWDNATDITAGATPLVDSPDDFGDPISGINALSNVLVISRERSLWIGTKNPIGSNPFTFYNAVPKVGCNAPWSIAVFEQGLVWFDQRTSTVWAYTVGGGIESIGRPIDNSIIKNIDDPGQVFGTYNPIENEYVLCIPVVGTTVVQCWTYNFRNKAWTYDEIYDISCADDVDISSGFISINNLIGNIDDFTVNIDDLSPPVNTQPTRAFGQYNGHIIYEDPNATLDHEREYTTELVSKIYEVPERDIIIGTIRLEIYAEADCVVTLSTRKNGGEWKQIKTKTITDLKKTIIFKHDKQIRCRQFEWKITGTGGKFSLLKDEIQVYASGKSKR